jgi:hypothetical protein
MAMMTEASLEMVLWIVDCGDDDDSKLLTAKSGNFDP